jgi:hypothetical protein
LSPDSSKSPTLLLGLLGLLLLGGLAHQHPELRQVDFLSFSGRSRRLLEGQDWIHPLYPSGYPMLLWVGRLPGLDLLMIGKLISVIAGVGAVVLSSRWLHPICGLWLLAHGALLHWGSSEGTDALAATLSIAAVLSAEQGRSRTAGISLGLACMVRYTALGALPVVLCMLWMRAPPEHRIAQLGRLTRIALLFTLPHWIAALLAWRSPIPDQAFNLAISAGHPTEFWSMDTLYRWPSGIRIALERSLTDWTTRIGLAGLVLAWFKRDARAWALTGLAVIHVVLIGLAFGSDRLLLPASMAFSLGVFGVLPTRHQVRPRAFTLACIGLGALVLIRQEVSQLSHQSPEALQRQEAVRIVQDLPGPVLSSTPWIYQVRSGWLEQSIPLRQAAFDPETGRAVGDHAIRPAQLHAFAQQRQISTIALDINRTGASYRSLLPLLRSEPPQGFRRVDEAPGWVFLQVE